MAARDEEDQRREQHRDGRRGADLAVLERLLEEADGGHARGVVRPAPGRDVDEVEAAERGDRR
jgi:hypothetical protein